MSRHRLLETTPPTYTGGEVVRILAGELEPSSLAKWDEAKIFRPTYYEDVHRTSGLMMRQERDTRCQQDGTYRGNPHRRYTFHDLVWLRFLIQVKKQLIEQGQKNATRRAARLVEQLRQMATNDAPPASSRLLFTADDVYLVLADGTVQCLTQPGQLALPQIVCDPIIAEMRGRVHSLRPGLANTRVSADNLQRRKSSAG